MNNFYKFIIGVLVATGLLFGIKSAFFTKTSQQANDTIYFFNWGDYVDPDILKEFEDETGYKVVYETFDSNEAMISKLQQKTAIYDLVVPSEYTVEMMVEKGLAKEIDKSKIEGLENISPEFLGHPFDPENKYSLPYLWGTFGIIYNSSYYSEEDFSSWKNLWDPKFNGQILCYDGAREILAIGLLAREESINTKDRNLLLQVEEDLKPFMNNIRAILADEIKMYMVQEEAPVGITFSGEAISAMEENEDLSYAIPDEGSNIWFDNLVIPTSSRNTEGAYALINFLLRPDIAARNAEYIGYSSPNAKALAYMDEETRQDKTLYPDKETIDKLEVFEYLGPELTIEYNDIFLELKIYK